MVLSLLLARAGVEVTVLEKHSNFLRDFRGDTVHASTLTLLDEVGLGEAFEHLPHRYLEQAAAQLDQQQIQLADFRRLPGRHRHIALVPQWDFLGLIAAACEPEPTHRLILDAEVTDVHREGGRVTGVTYFQGDNEHRLAADLVVACDGRGSTVRERAGLRPREFGVPMDVLWFRLPRRSGDPVGGFGRVSHGTMLVLIDRGDYFQVGYLIRKGTDAQVRADGIERFRRRLADALPWLGDRVDELRSFDDVKLLSVALSRLRRWWLPGLLLIGDAAHAMSPVGGVGINLAIQDAVAASRLLGPRLVQGRMRGLDLARVQARRWLPTAVTQAVQRAVHHYVLGPVALTPSPRPVRPAAPIRALQRFPALQAIPAYLIGIGLLPEHAPAWARRLPSIAREQSAGPRR
jgi:2-polyprenyl-6-methoxyphenol hydroxylase-like FAD-dependent oxidoreductase